MMDEPKGKTMQAARIEPTITYGNMIQTIVLLLSLAGFVWWQARFQENTVLRLDAGELRAAKYAPMLEQAVETNKLQDERLSGIGDSIRSLRETTNSVLQKQGVMGEDIASIKAKLQTE